MTTSTPAPVDPGALADLLVHLEALADRDGWDGEPALLIIYRADDRQTDTTYRAAMPHSVRVRRGPYAALSMLPAGGMLPDPGKAVYRLALNLEHKANAPLLAPTLRMLRQPGLVALALQTEAWVRSGTEEEMGRDLADSDHRPFVDIPGSVESRLVFAVDTDARFYFVLRPRGGPVESSHGVDDHQGQGCIRDSLQMALAVITGRVPRPVGTSTPAGWSWVEEYARAAAVHRDRL